ncbi:MAG: hypothetical protein ACE5GW_11190, partial [Planctomycetota bacterium]
GGNAARARLAVILVGAGSILVNHTQVAPSLSRLESPRPLAEEIRRLIDSGAEVALYALRLNADYLFYSGSLSLPELNEAAEIDEFLEEATPRLVVAKDRYFQKVVGQLEKPHEVICEIREGRNRVLLLGNREGAAMHRKLCRFHPARGGDAKVAGDGAGAASALEMRR